LIAPAVENLRHDRTALEAELRFVGATIKGNDCTCVGHGDNHASASIHQGDDGAWRVTCHKPGCGWGGDLFDIRTWASKRPVGEVLKAAAGNGNGQHTAPAKPKPVFATLTALTAGLANVATVHQYRNPEDRNVIDMAVVRIEDPGAGKRFIQARPVPGGGWMMEAPAKPWPIYARPAVVKADAVVVVEGEKCVERLYPLGIVATTSPGGAKNGKNADWSMLAGKTVYLWRDNDEPGTVYVRDVQSMLEPLRPSVRLLRVRVEDLGLSDGGDVVDYLDANGGNIEDQRAAVQLVLDEAEPLGVSRELEERFAAMKSGKWSNVAWPTWPRLTKSARALYPGTVTVLCGDPGSTKSFWLLEAMWRLHLAGVPVALFELEEDRVDHLIRAVSQMEQNSNLTDAEWVKENSAEQEKAMARNREFVDDFGPCMASAPDREIGLDELTAWVEARAKAGARVIGIDPVTAAAASSKPWLDDQRFILATKRLMREYTASLVLVTHPRSLNVKVKGETHLDNLAGGRAYSRFTQTIFWMHAADDDKTKTVKRMAINGQEYQEQVMVNRTLRQIKARNGRGRGMEFGLWFDPATLCFAEQGMLVKE
jgi:KaiC/GvpD/RAD55 family RecA-like ATPase